MASLFEFVMSLDGTRRRITAEATGWSVLEEKKGGINKYIFFFFLKIHWMCDYSNYGLSLVKNLSRIYLSLQIT